MRGLVYRGLLGLARSRWGRFVLGRVVGRMSFALPVERLRETGTLLAFHHPRPSHALHILLVPKEPYGSLMELPPRSTDFMRDLVETVQQLVRDFHLEEQGYRLVANGGRYQEVPYLHFHLIADQ
jgi:diadenosine tetraphosphate (Ap4A) HIT family hydrolase